MNRRDVTALILFAGGLVVAMGLWFLAFYPTPGVTSEWLLRTQTACFGGLENGLPSSGGWTVLIFSPLAYISAVMLVFSRELAKAFPLFFSKAIGKMVVVLLVGLLLMEGLWSWGKIRDGVNLNSALNQNTLETLPEHYPRLSKSAPDFTLINAQGEKVSLKSQKGKPVVLTFAFAHCKTLCPQIMKQVTEAMKNPVGNEIGMVITLDPWRDTPASLLQMSRDWNTGGRLEVLSGTTEEVIKTLSAYEVPMERNLTNGDIIHPPIVILIDREGNIAYKFNRPDANWIREGLKRI